MTKSDKNKYKILTDMDIKIIRQDPEGLADYIVCTKAKEIKKTALIATIIFMVISFGVGVLVGTTWTKSSIPNNVVQIQVGETSQPAVIENTEVEK